MWIRHVDEDDAEGEVARLYRREKRSWGGVDNIIKSSSLHPGALDALLRFYRRVMHGECETSLAQREMIAVTVSVLNHCHY